MKIKNVVIVIDTTRVHRHKKSKSARKNVILLFLLVDESDGGDVSTNANETKKTKWESNHFESFFFVLFFAF